MDNGDHACPLPRRCSLVEFRERFCTKKSQCLAEMCSRLSLGWLCQTVLFQPLGQLIDSECNKELLDQSRATNTSNTRRQLSYNCHQLPPVTLQWYSQLHFHQTLLSVLENCIWERLKMAGRPKATWCMANGPTWSAIASQIRVQDAVKWVGQSRCRLDKIITNMSNQSSVNNVFLCLISNWIRQQRGLHIQFFGFFLLL